MSIKADSAAIAIARREEILLPWKIFSIIKIKTKGTKDTIAPPTMYPK